MKYLRHQIGDLLRARGLPVLAIIGLFAAGVDASGGGVAPGSNAVADQAMTLLAPLFAFVLAHDFAGSEARHGLYQVLFSQGTSPRRFYAGKLVACWLASALAAVVQGLATRSWDEALSVTPVLLSLQPRVLFVLTVMACLSPLGRHSWLGFGAYFAVAESTRWWDLPPWMAFARPPRVADVISQSYVMPLMTIVALLVYSVAFGIVFFGVALPRMRPYQRSSRR